MSYAELAGLVEFRPLSESLPAPTYNGWNGSPFSASWTATVDKLVDELRHLKAEKVLLEVDVQESDLRLDGMPRANARAASPGVILTLINVPVAGGLTLRYPCSTFQTWEANVRAIALALEALRKVDRYGVTKRGEQYAGWKALPAGEAQYEPDLENGARIIAAYDGSVRKAIMGTHPDTREEGYDDDDFKDVVAYKEANGL